MLKETDFKKMFISQDEINNNTYGKQWSTKELTSDGRVINWHRMLRLQASRAIDAINSWKFWKNKIMADDDNRVLVEFITIWSSLMSEMIRKRGVKKGYKKSYKAYIAAQKSSKYKKKTILELLEEMQRLSLMNKTPLAPFFILIEKHELFNATNLYKHSVGKTILKQFRLDNGFKEKKYRRVWSGNIEDKTILFNLIQSNPFLDKKKIYKELERVYNATTL